MQLVDIVYMMQDAGGFSNCSIIIIIIIISINIIIIILFIYLFFCIMHIMFTFPKLERPLGSMMVNVTCNDIAPLAMM